MSAAGAMTVALRLPTRVLFRGFAVKLAARAENGAFGILPNHIDLVTTLAPGVLSLITPDGNERLFGTDEGVFLKQGVRVDICVRRAIEGSDLALLKDEVRTAFVDLDDQERHARTALARLESDIVRRFAELKGMS